MEDVSRIRSLSRQEASPETHEYFDRNEAAFGMVLPTTGILAYCPSIMRAVQGLSGALNSSTGISARLRLLLYVRVAARVGCPF